MTEIFKKNFFQSGHMAAMGEGATYFFPDGEEKIFHTKYGEDWNRDGSPDKKAINYYFKKTGIRAVVR